LIYSRQGDLLSVDRKDHTSQTLMPSIIILRNRMASHIVDPLCVVESPCYAKAQNTECHCHQIYKSPAWDAALQEEMKITQNTTNLERAFWRQGTRYEIYSIDVASDVNHYVISFIAPVRINR
jgi:hypothetical protein